MIEHNHTKALSKIPNATVFRFDGYVFDKKKKWISFNFAIEFANKPTSVFTEKILLPRSLTFLNKNLTDDDVARFLQPLHIILGISYYKLYCPPKLTLPFALNKKQADFWDTVYQKGLGEFLYRNHIDPDTIARFPFLKKTKDTTTAKTSYTKTSGGMRLSLPNRALLGIGGGKDSLVCAELLKNFDVTSFFLETQKKDPATQNVIRIIGNPSLHIKRILDPNIFQHHVGSFNGHIPISAIYAFIGLLSAGLYGYKHIIVGNEHTSDFGNLIWKNTSINHQWSKSAEFESLLREYTRAFISPDITYFSLLRPFYEIRVAKMFSQYPQYFNSFTSCNNNFKVFKKRPETLWCGTCPKCAYVFLLLAAFLPKKTLINIFKKNLLADITLTPLYKDILGFGSSKPFDCVGTFEESQAALFLASKHFKNESIVRTFLPKIKKPQQLVQKVFKTSPAPTVPEQFIFSGLENVCILGYGKEGKITKKYIHKYYPHIKIDILDQSRDPDYLQTQDQYDFAIKTPGIQKSKVTIPYTTATNIFFSQINNQVIGVTGSKGKSTTASLIYQILKTAGKKVRMVGNIGFPMLEVLLKKIDPKEIFVVELSSYMLDDIHYSPNIAVLLNLFPEHMDYHGSIQNYYQAKQKIFAFQKTNDIALRPPFHVKIPVPKNEIPLRGTHNIQNIKAAIAVAKQLNIKDEIISKAIRQFQTLPHRLEFIGTYHDIDFYDDAISTTPQSTIKAIQTLRTVGTIFLGGQDRGFDFTELAHELKKYRIKNIVLFPDSGRRILPLHHDFHVLTTNDMQTAVRFAYRYTPKGKSCLLSTASPSYSLWKNFEEKGNLFQKFVKKFKP
ncbi:MAG: Mur ligase family protein [bacterium]|nr:Mur ligase family protein [bacterium]